MNDDLHSKAGFVAERYLLGELTAEEREQFEEHFFSCQECADRVLATATFVDGARAVLPQMDRAPAPKPVSEKFSQKGFRWFPWTLAPEAALACIALLGVITVYQNAVEIPKLRASAAGNELVLSGAQYLTARRAPSDLKFSVRNSIAPVLVANEWEESFPKYVLEVRQGSRPQPIESATSVSASGPLGFIIPVARLGVGEYTMILYGVTAAGERQVVARRPFTIQE